MFDTCCVSIKVSTDTEQNRIFILFKVIVYSYLILKKMNERITDS